MTTGEAAGVAAALCAKTDTACAELPIDFLQSQLLKSGAYLGEGVSA
jgi:hypothetical protein